jgi:beta-lactamase class A
MIPMISRRQCLGGVALTSAGLAGALPAQAAAGIAGLPHRFARIEAARGGRLGVAVLDTGTGRQAGYRQDERFPILSTYKTLAAAAVLARADAGKDSMERRVRFTRDDLVTYSPVTEKHVGQGMTLAALCEAAIVTSDNTAGNLLFDAVEGPAGLTAWLRTIGDPVTRLDRLETALNEALPGDPRDTTTPAAMVLDLQALALGSVLSSSSRERLVAWLRGCRTGDARLRARLPQGWTAGEKTGTGERNSSNDAGLLWPPNGAPPVLVAAYLTGGAADSAVRDAALADVGAAVAEALSS